MPSITFSGTDSTISVSMKPGATQFTVTPMPPPSLPFFLSD